MKHLQTERFVGAFYVLVKCFRFFLTTMDYSVNL